MRKMSLILGLGTLIFLVGCASSKKEIKDDQTPISDIKMDESFDPLQLNDEDISFESVVNARDESSSVINFPKRLDSTEVENALVDGFRIQLISTKDLESAIELKQIASEQFQELEVNLYLEFDSPYYKLRLGDFIARNNAEQARDQVRFRGYPKAWIVPSKVWTNPEIAQPLDSLGVDLEIKENKN